MGYIGVITHLLTIDPNFLGHPSKRDHWKILTMINYCKSKSPLCVHGKVLWIQLKKPSKQQYQLFLVENSHIFIRVWKCRSIFPGASGIIFQRIWQFLESLNTPKVLQFTVLPERTRRSCSTNFLGDCSTAPPPKVSSSKILLGSSV